MKLERTFDATFLNTVVNDPDVYPWVHGATVGPMDLSSVLRDRSNICLMGEHGGVLFTPMQPGIYELHTQVLKAGRGKWTIAMMQDAFHHMFTRTDCLEILTRVPKGNVGALAGVRIFKATYEFTRPNAWVMDHKPIPADIYSYSIQQWMRSAPGLVKQGVWFHDRIVGEYTRMGAKDRLLAESHSHDDDENHNRYVGAAVEMFMGGQPYKAVVFYNRWARIAGFPEISLLKAEPVIIDTTESILMVKDNDLRVVSCRLV